MAEAELTHIVFWDVGQGDCSVLHLSDKSIIIIDTGDKKSPLVEWLSWEEREIRAIVLTHTHADHIGAVHTLVEVHVNRVRSIFMLPDRPPNDATFKELFRNVKVWERKTTRQVRWAVPGTKIWESPSKQTKLEIVHPNLSEFASSADLNSRSTILVLAHDSVSLAVWSGDSSLNAVAEKVPNRPLAACRTASWSAADHRKRTKPQFIDGNIVSSARVHFSRNQKQTRSSEADLSTTPWKHRLPDCMLRNYPSLRSTTGR